MMQPQPGASTFVADESIHALLDPALPVTDPVLQLVQLAMTGFGYNFYDAKNVARSNDVLVRQKLSGELHDAGRALEVLERAYHDRYIGPATREHPFPSAEQSRRKKALHDAAMECDAIASALIVAESPGRDAIWSRFRDEGQTLVRLVSFDVALVANTKALSDTVAALTPAACDSDSALDGVNEIARGLRKSLSERRALLTV